MLGLVVKETHAQNGPYRTAADGDAQKSFFLDPRLVGLGFLFIDTETGKSQDIYKCKVHKDVL